MPSQTLSDFTPWREWVGSPDAGHIKSPGQFDWILRQYKSELIASGEFIPGQGKRPALCGKELGRVLTDLMRKGAAA
jgi:hypothetical protein